MISTIKKVLSPSVKALKYADKLADQVIELDAVMQELTDEELKHKTEEFKNRIEMGETLDDLLIEAFAVVREASMRVLGMKPYKVQIIGGITLHGGNIAEMRTGEGKTLTSTMPAYLNALEGKGVHIITVNEYLSSRDAREMGELFQWLGLTVGLNSSKMTSSEKRQQYLCDITYTTNNELGFDYLRDHMVKEASQMVQRKLNYAIIDEVDSILIDEARTPLIISGGKKKTANLYLYADQFVKMLTNEDDYTIDIKTKNIQLNVSGIDKAEQIFKIKNLYEPKHAVLLHHINNALKANYIMVRDVDYVVQEDEIVIVDQFTGRLMKGRAYSEGLHQAIQAKEGVAIKEETATLATITFQNLFRLYCKLSGMTGTAKTDEEELRHIYNMMVVEIPTNRVISRLDAPDLVYKDMNAKFNAVVEEVVKRHEKGQPILIGTVAVETSEYLSKLLTQKGIVHNVLNAKNHEREAEIIIDAGKKGAVTIATNMAGRGTDIKLTDEVKDLGGLVVIGTERHESRRIDNQLRGRAGRQGDPGYTRFYLSFEDELMRRFGSERMQLMADKLGMEETDPIESKMVSKAVESSQKRVEGNNYDMRKSLLEYDDVIRRQRELIYDQRQIVLESKDLTDIVLGIFESSIERLIPKYELPSISKKGKMEKNYDYEGLLGYVNIHYFSQNRLSLSDLSGKNESELVNVLFERAKQIYEGKKQLVNGAIFLAIQKTIVLNVVDSYWMNHIDVMDALRQGIHLRSYGQINPLHEYQTEGFELFNHLIERIEDDIIRYILHAQIRYDESEETTETLETSNDKISEK